MELKPTKQGYVDGLIQLAAENPKVVVLDCDVSKATKTCDFESVYPERFFNCGVQEGNMMSVAAGMALEGFLPFATTFGMFATFRAADQLRNSIAYPKLDVKVGATHCGITTGGDGASHQVNEDIAVARALPNMTVLVPGDYEEARQATLASAEFPGPVYLRFGRDQYPVVPDLGQEYVIGKAKRLREGSDLCIVTTGIMVAEGLEASELLARQGISARVIHMHTVKPLDGEVLIEAARETKGIVTAEEHSILGGLGEAVSGFLSERHPCPVRRVGVRDLFGESGTAAELMDLYGLRAADIMEEALQLV